MDNTLNVMSVSFTVFSLTVFYVLQVSRNLAAIGVDVFQYSPWVELKRQIYRPIEELPAGNVQMQRSQPLLCGTLLRHVIVGVVFQ